MTIDESPDTTVDADSDLAKETNFEHGASSNVSYDGVVNLGDDTQDTYNSGAHGVVTLGDDSQDTNNIEAEHLLSNFIGTPASDDDDAIVDMDELTVQKRNLVKMYGDQSDDEIQRGTKSRKLSK